MSVKSIAIAGFTSRLARLITRNLLDNHPQVSIHGICRSPSKVASEIKSLPNVKLFQAEWNDKSAIKQAVSGTDVCISCYHGDDALMHDGQKVLIDASIEQGVPRYIASEWNLDCHPLKMGDLPAKDPVKKVYAYLKEKEAAGAIKSIHMLTGAFMETMLSMNFVMGDSPDQPPTFSYWGTGDEPMELTTMPNAAAWTVAVAMDPAAVEMKRCKYHTRS
jgi:hypothetical protein